MSNKILLGLVAFLVLLWLALVIPPTVDYIRQRNPETILFDTALVEIKAGNVKEIVEQTDVAVLVLHDNTHQQFARPTTNDLYIILLESGVSQSQLDQIHFVGDVTGSYFRIQSVVSIYVVSYAIVLALWLLILVFTTIHLWRRDLTLSLKTLYFVGVVALPVFGVLVYWLNVPAQRYVKQRA